MARLDELGQVGAIAGGGVCRLALSDADRQGRDLVTGWMRELGLTVTTDRIGNVIGQRAGRTPGSPVLMGSHIDTVATGGRYDGNLGVLAGLEVVRALAERNHVTEHPIAVGFFTNVEGARFQPDMLGSGVHQGGLSLEDCVAATDRDGLSVGAELERIGYAGAEPCGTFRARAYVKLHIKQKPMLEREGIDLGAVEGVQGISWTELTIEGVSNHAGTTPMAMRHDAGYVAGAITAFVRKLANDIGGAQVGTVGLISLVPNLVNVVANRAKMTVDLRNTDEATLQRAVEQVMAYADQVAEAEGVTLSARTLARFEPVEFSAEVVDLVAQVPGELGHSVKRMPSGAGHDAQMFAPNCPTGMIFVPSRGGISHNVAEHTDPEQIESGANVLLQVVLRLADAT